MTVARRKSRLAKIASSSWTKLPPNTATPGPLGHPQDIDRGEERAEHAGEEPHGIRRLPGAQEREELGHEAGRGGQPERGETADRERRRDPGHHPPEARHLEDLPRVGLLVDEP